MNGFNRMVFVVGLATLIFVVGSGKANDEPVTPSATQPEIDRICARHPVLNYVIGYKEGVMNKEMQTKLEQCLIGDVNTELFDWNIIDGKLEGCLTQKLGFQELKLYTENIAEGYKDAISLTKELMDEYINCNNLVRKNMRICGKANCPSIKKNGMNAETSR